MTDVVIGFVNVGQGDCVVAVDRDCGRAMLIDCPEGRHREALAALRDYGATRLDLAVVTHQHLDHLGGVYPAVTSFPTARVRMNTVTHMPANLQEKRKHRAALRAMEGLPRQNVTMAGAYAGDEGRVGAIRWQVLAPDHPQLLYAQSVSRPNHASVVIKLSIAAHSILLGSDADARSWAAILARGADITADVFQIPHHGAHMVSEGANVDLGHLLDRVQASLHLISVGSNNNHGHPAASTLADIHVRRERAKTFCTQLNAVCARRDPGANARCAGTVTLTFRDGTMSVSPGVAEHSAAVSTLPAAQCI